MTTTTKKLDSLFIHHNWFRTKNEKTGGWKAYETKRNALKYFAYSGDFILDDKIDIKRNETINLFDKLPTKSILRYCGKERGSYNISDYEIRYFVFLKLVVKEYNFVLEDIFTRQRNETAEKSQNRPFYAKDYNAINYKYYLIKKKCLESLKNEYETEFYLQLLDLLEDRNLNVIREYKEYNLIAS